MRNPQNRFYLRNTAGIITYINFPATQKQSYQKREKDRKEITNHYQLIIDRVLSVYMFNGTTTNKKLHAVFHQLLFLYPSFLRSHENSKSKKPMVLPAAGLVSPKKLQEDIYNLVLLSTGFELALHYLTETSGNSLHFQMPLIQLLVSCN